jgi:hypothetical protein
MPLNLLAQITLLELRTQRRNPVWMISVAAAALLGFSEMSGSGTLDGPTTHQALRAYQLGSAMILGTMTFLLTAGSLSRDLSHQRKDLLLSRPVNLPMFLAGKYLGNVGLALGVSGLLMIAYLAVPYMDGQSASHPLAPFIMVALSTTLPCILFCGALAMLFVSVARKAIVAIPVFLVYFLVVALFRIQDSFRTLPPDIDLWDFSMRLYPRSGVTYVGMTRLADESFAHLLCPMAPALLLRALLYTALSLGLLGLSMLTLDRMRSRT